MMTSKALLEKIFSIKTKSDFNETAMEVFYYQFNNNTVYNKWVNYLNTNIRSIKHYSQIPFLPISLFKTKAIKSFKGKEEIIFRSSGTTGMEFSRHYIYDLDIYRRSYLTAFNQFYGDINEYTILALLPSYLERKGSSLIMMVEDMINRSNQKESGFYLYNYSDLRKTLLELKSQSKKVLLIGVSFALLEFAENYNIDFPELKVMETGGMKGKRKELLREELHSVLCKSFGTSKIHSEYGMTELLSQAYSKGDGIFECPPWMKTLIRDTNDPLYIHKEHKSGGINIIDLCNLHSCSFIATQDLGKLHSDNSFEILGRFDNSDIRGCNLLIL